MSCPRQLPSDCWGQCGEGLSASGERASLSPGADLTEGGEPFLLGPGLPGQRGGEGWGVSSWPCAHILVAGTLTTDGDSEMESGD